MQAGMAEWQSARLESVSPYGVQGSNPCPGVFSRIRDEESWLLVSG